MRIDKDHVNQKRKQLGLRPLPVKRGRPPIGDPPTKAQLSELYLSLGYSIRVTAQVLGVSKEAVWRGLAEYGIKSRETSRPSKLAVYGVRELRRRIRASGLRATARALELDPRALTGYLERHGRKR